MTRHLVADPTSVKEGVHLQIESETDLLEKVFVHTPGVEMELVLPGNRLELLFDDILFVDQARAEHELMCSVFSKIVGSKDAVLQISDLLKEVFELEDARLDFIGQLCSVSQERNLQGFEHDLTRLSPVELFDFAMTGQSPLPIVMHPLPNLLFIRDVAAVVHDHIILSHAATAARTRESLILRTILEHHPLFAAHRDNVIVLPQGVTFEGGDLLMADESCVIIGHSERTSFSGVISIAQELFERTPVEHVLMVDLPKARYCMHLDTVFTFASANECVVFPPLIAEGHIANVIHYTKSDEPNKFYSEIRIGLRGILEDVMGRELEFIPCGGSNTLSQMREQWTDGANLFAVAPGVVIGYERNESTFNELRDRGYRVVSAEGFLSYYAQSNFDPGEKVGIKLEGNELSRGRGGPRCMTLPISRQGRTA